MKDTKKSASKPAKAAGASFAAVQQAGVRISAKDFDRKRAKVGAAGPEEEEERQDLVHAVLHIGGSKEQQCVIPTLPPALAFQSVSKGGDSASHSHGTVYQATRDHWLMRLGGPPLPTEPGSRDAPRPLLHRFGAGAARADPSAFSAGDPEEELHAEDPFSHAAVELSLRLAAHVQGASAELQQPSQRLVWRDNFRVEQPGEVPLHGMPPAVPGPLQELARRVVAELRSRKQATLQVQVPGPAAAGGRGTGPSPRPRKGGKDKPQKSAMKDAVASLLEANPGLKESSARCRSAALQAVLAAEAQALACSAIGAFVDGTASSKPDGQCMGWQDVLTAFAVPRPPGRRPMGPGGLPQWDALGPADAALLLAKAQARLAEIYE